MGVVTDWHQYAPCASIGGDSWFPEPGDNALDVKLICESCPYKKPCLEGALARGERHGIWGGVAMRQHLRNTPNPRPRRTDTHCCNGHPWVGDERIKPNGSVVCRTCQVEQFARSRAKRRAA